MELAKPNANHIPFNFKFNPHENVNNIISGIPKKIIKFFNTHNIIGYEC